MATRSAAALLRQDLHALRALDEAGHLGDSLTDRGPELSVALVVALRARDCESLHPGVLLS